MQKIKGFTLIELLIAIVIIGVLAAIAFPYYQDSITKSRRSDAQAALLGFAQAMERNYTSNGQYTGAAAGGADTGAPTIYSTTSPVDGSSAYYNLTIVSAASSTYILAAAPVNEQAGDGVLLLNSAGARGWDEDNSANGVASENAIDADEWSW